MPAARVSARRSRSSVLPVETTMLRPAPLEDGRSMTAGDHRTRRKKGVGRPARSALWYRDILPGGGIVADRIERELQRHMARLYGYALSLTGDRDAAQDL